LAVAPVLLKKYPGAGSQKHDEPGDVPSAITVPVKFRVVSQRTLDAHCTHRPSITPWSTGHVDAHTASTAFVATPPSEPVVPSRPSTHSWFVAQATVAQVTRATHALPFQRLVGSVHASPHRAGVPSTQTRSPQLGRCAPVHVSAATQAWFTRRKPALQSPHTPALTQVRFCASQVWQLDAGTHAVPAATNPGTHSPHRASSDVVASMHVRLCAKQLSSAHCFTATQIEPCAL
jgi:hypothetical protein